MCPSGQQIDQWLRATEASAELDAFRAHARECARCRMAVAHAADRALVGQVMLESGHLEASTLSRHLDGATPASVRMLVEIHLEACGACRERMEAMRSGRQRAAAQPVVTYRYAPVAEVVRESRTRAGAAPAWRYAAAVAAAAILFVVGVFGRSPRIIDRLRDGTLTLALTPQGLRVEGVSAENKKLIAGKLSISGDPQSLAALPPTPRTLGAGSGEARPGAVSIISPLPDESLVDPHVSIRWRRLPEVEQYRVKLYRGDRLETPLFEKTVAATQLQISLSPGENYTLIVGGGRSSSPAIAFEVASQGAMKELSERLAASGDSHLLRGILFEQRRCFSKALAEYETLRNANPRSAMARNVAVSFRKRLEGGD